jgi:hypothetical protein
MKWNLAFGFTKYDDDGLFHEKIRTFACYIITCRLLTTTDNWLIKYYYYWLLIDRRNSGQQQKCKATLTNVAWKMSFKKNFYDSLWYFHLSVLFLISNFCHSGWLQNWHFYYTLHTCTGRESLNEPNVPVSSRQSLDDSIMITIYNDYWYVLIHWNLKSKLWNWLQIPLCEVLENRIFEILFCILPDWFDFNIWNDMQYIVYYKFN